MADKKIYSYNKETKSFARKVVPRIDNEGVHHFNSEEDMLIYLGIDPNSVCDV